MIGFNFRIAIRYLFICGTCFVHLYFLYINIDEVIQRSLHHYTLFAQLSWLTDNEAILYCTGWIIVAVSILIPIIYNLYWNRTRLTKILCIVAWLLIITSLLVDTLVYNPRI
jgi:hypothetical protein